LRSIFASIYYSILVSNYIQQDTLIIAGTEDKVIPSINSEILKDKIEIGQLETFVGGGHALMFQFPERLSEVINTFLDK
jgi:pimeloyl-ACP methyl ester carboxylesterase